MTYDKSAKTLCPGEVISQHEILLRSVPGCIQAKKRQAFYCHWYQVMSSNATATQAVPHHRNGTAVPIAAKQPPAEQGLPQSTSDSANLDTSLALQTSRRTTPAEDLEHFPDQVSRNLVNEPPGDGSQNQ